LFHSTYTVDISVTDYGQAMGKELWHVQMSRTIPTDHNGVSSMNESMSHQTHGITITK